MTRKQYISLAKADARRLKVHLRDEDPVYGSSEKDFLFALENKNWLQGELEAYVKYFGDPILENAPRKVFDEWRGPDCFTFSEGGREWAPTLFVGNERPDNPQGTKTLRLTVEGVEELARQLAQFSAADGDDGELDPPGHKGDD